MPKKFRSKNQWSLNFKLDQIWHKLMAEINKLDKTVSLPDVMQYGLCCKFEQLKAAKEMAAKLDT